MSPDLNFDANKVEPIGTFEPMPVGDYLVSISASEMKDTKPKPNKKPGKYLQLTLDILEGPHKGRKVFDFLNLVNENKTTEEIAQKQLSSICRVTGVMRPKKSEELHNIPFMVKLKIQKGTDGYDDSNRIADYKFANGKTLKEAEGKPAASAPVRTESPPAQKMPWET
jgi:hypothetical protein